MNEPRHRRSLPAQTGSSPAAGRLRVDGHLILGRRTGQARSGCEKAVWQNDGLPAFPVVQT